MDATTCVSQRVQRDYRQHSKSFNFDSVGRLDQMLQHALLPWLSALLYATPERSFAPIARQQYSHRTETVFALLSDLSDEAVSSALTPGERKLAEALQIRLSLSDTETLRMVVRHPELLGYSWESNLAPTLDALQKSLSLEPAELKKVVLALPAALGLSLESTLKPRLLALRKLFGLSVPEMRSLILKYPNLLALSVEQNVQPTQRALRSLLGLSDAELASLVMKYPQALSLSAANNIQPTLDALRTLLCIDGPPGGGGGGGSSSSSPDECHTVSSDSDLRVLVLRFPSVLGLSVDSNLKPKLHFLATSLKLSPEALRGCVLREPAVLGASLERSLRPNVQLWSEALPDSDLGEIASRRGLRFLSCSHYKRSLPRLTRARQAGVDAEVLITKMRLTDAAFETWLALEVTRARRGDEDTSGKERAGFGVSAAASEESGVDIGVT